MEQLQVATKENVDEHILGQHSKDGYFRNDRVQCFCKRRLIAQMLFVMSLTHFMNTCNLYRIHTAQMNRSVQQLKLITTLSMQKHKIAVHPNM